MESWASARQSLRTGSSITTKSWLRWHPDRFQSDPEGRLLSLLLAATYLIAASVHDPAGMLKNRHIYELMSALTVPLGMIWLASEDSSLRFFGWYILSIPAFAYLMIHC